jgi:hypothetical protein
VKKLVTMRQALQDPAILGSAFSRDKGDTWLAWRALLTAIAGEALTRKERRAFQSLTKRAQEPLEVAEEFIAIVGRRGGKTLAGAVLLVFLACLIDWSTVLNVGERAVALCLAQNQKQATISLNYIDGIIESSPMLCVMKAGQRTQDTISLTNGVDITVMPSSFRSVRGVTSVAILADELAFWPSEGVHTDSAVLNALRPSLATTGGMLVVLSSPYAEKGELFELYERHYGPDGDPRIVVVQGASRDLNPSLPERVVIRALERDAVAAAAEYLGQFRADVTGFINRELLMQAVDEGITERPPSPQFEYIAFCDAASGIASSGDGDRFAVAVGHRFGDVVVIDYCRRWMPPFNASEVTAEVAAIARAYRCNEVISDGFSSGYLRAELLRHSVGHRISEFNKSELYLASLPMITSCRVRLPDLKFLIDEFAALERRPGSGGHDKIDARGHEDAANVCAGVIAQFAAAEPSSAENWLEYYRRLAETEGPSLAAIPNKAPEFAYSISAPFAGAKERVRVPDGISTLYLIDGSAVNVPEDRVVEVSHQDAVAFGQSGWERLAIT